MNINYKGLSISLILFIFCLTVLLSVGASKRGFGTNDFSEYSAYVNNDIIREPIFILEALSEISLGATFWAFNLGENGVISENWGALNFLRDAINFVLAPFAWARNAFMAVFDIIAVLFPSFKITTEDDYNDSAVVAPPYAPSFGG